MQDSRDSLGLHLKGSIVVVDEAHNLVDAVNGAHCAEVSAQQLSAAEAQMSAYFERFRTRLAAGRLLTKHTQDINAVTFDVWTDRQRDLACAG